MLVFDTVYTATLIFSVAWGLGPPSCTVDRIVFEIWLGGL